jgi:flagellar hook assembly protein FlgD
MVRIVSMAGIGVAIEDQRVVIPSDYILEQNYPNPFNPETTIRFTLPLDKNVSVRVFDVSGRLVKTLVDNQLYTQGTYEVTWNGTSQDGTAVASGTYLYSLEYGNFRQSKTMILLK